MLHQWRHLPPVVGEVDVHEPKVAAPGGCLVLEVAELERVTIVVEEVTVSVWANGTDEVLSPTLLKI